MRPFSRSTSNWHCNSSSKGFDSRYGGREGGADPGNTSMWWSIVRRGGRVDGSSSGKTSWNSSSRTCKSLLSRSVVSVVVSIIPSAEFPAVTQARNPSSPCRRAWRACFPEMKFSWMSESSPGEFLIQSEASRPRWTGSNSNLVHLKVYLWIVPR